MHFSTPGLARQLVFFLLSIVLAGSLLAGDGAKIHIRGSVFEDSNENGIRDAGEKGLAKVVLSDGNQVLQSGGDGGYQLDSEVEILFVSVPVGYRATASFWHRIAEGSASAQDFALIRLPEVERFDFIHASDTHLNEQTLPRFLRLKEIVAQRKPHFVLITGDLIKDALRVPEEVASGLYELFLKEIADFPVPVWLVPGNHEIFGIERHHSLVSKDHPLYGKKMYRKFLGPNYYSFNYGRIHFIGLDSVGINDLWYYGWVDGQQLAWLEKDLAQVAPGTTVVTFNHIPFYSAAQTIWTYTDTGPAPTLIKVGDKTQFRHGVANTQEVLAHFKDHRLTLALAGHTHVGERLVFETVGQRTRFHQSSAVVGPVADNASGVFHYRVDGDHIDNGTFIPLDAAKKE